MCVVQVAADLMNTGNHFLELSVNDGFSSWSTLSSSLPGRGKELCYYSYPIIGQAPSQRCFSDNAMDTYAAAFGDYDLDST